MLTREIENSKAAIVSVEAVLNGKREPDGLKRREAAERLNVTVETLRRKKPHPA